MEPIRWHGWRNILSGTHASAGPAVDAKCDFSEDRRAGCSALCRSPAGNCRFQDDGDQEYDGLIGRTSQVNGLCLAADGLSFDMAVMRMTMEMFRAQETPAQPPS